MGVAARNLIQGRNTDDGVADAAAAEDENRLQDLLVFHCF